MTAEISQLIALTELMTRFRGESGCAWHEAQTHESLVPFLIEEAAEVIDAIEDGTADDLREELGDLLFQVLFHADIAEANGEFTLEDVAGDLAAKLRKRNPHVFGDTPTRDIDEIIQLWTAAKAEQKRHRTSVLDGVSHAMPGLALAAKVLGKAGQAGVDIAPETFTAEAAHRDDHEDAFGDALLAAVASGRGAGIDSERALRGAVRRLERRIRAQEATAANQATDDGADTN